LRERVEPGHKQHLAGVELVDDAAKLRPVGLVPAAASGGAELVKLAVEVLPVGADANTAETAVFGTSFGHILRKL
jgi:hypothetical protein